MRYRTGRASRRFHAVDLENTGNRLRCISAQIDAECALFALAKAAEDGPLQMSLFDTQNFAEITHPDYPGERLVCCRNPFLAGERARKHQALLDATQQQLDKIVTSAAASRLRGPIGSVSRSGNSSTNTRSVRILITITEDTFAYHRDEPQIAAEAALDGIYVIRTNLETEKLDSPAVVEAYKNLAHLERDFRSIKSDDLDLRPIRHYLPDRVKAHVLLCMLAAYLTRHLRQAFAPVTFTDENISPHSDPVTPAQRSAEAKATDAPKNHRRSPHPRLPGTDHTPGKPHPQYHLFRRSALR
jgi:hypothetical protein